jgi:anaerobic selenocysteine-containing dehydrogenase
MSKAEKFGDPAVATNARVSDEIKYTTCYMCACRCGIKVSLRDGKVRYIEGNKDHPVNKGVLCAKGSAGIMQHYSPARLRKPLLRTGERGSGEFREIEWEEAMSIATEWLGNIRKTDPKKLAFFTGRDQSQALTGWWAAQFGTMNYAAHGGFCSVNMAAGGLYTVGGSFWEFGEPDWDRSKYFMLFGVAEDHDSNPIKIGLGKLKRNGAKVVSVNPIRTGYSAIADEWLGIRPGTDGLFILSLVHELLRAGKIDADFLARYTNSPWLVIQDRGGAEDGLFYRVEGAPQVYDRKRKKIVSALDPDAAPSLSGEYELPDGRKAVPSFMLLAERYLSSEYAPDAVTERTGIPAATIKRIAAELAHVAFEQEIVVEQPWTDWAGRRHERMIGRPISIHAMRGISAHSNGFHTCRALHMLQTLLGAIDTPGAFRYEPPFPKPIPPNIKPAGPAAKPGDTLNGPPLGFPQGPEDLLLDEKGNALRIDKAFSWEAPLSPHGMLHTVIANAHRGDPYRIDTLFLYMANMSWNSAMNTAGTMKMLTDKDENGEYKIPRIIYSDAYYSEMVAYSDLIFPDTTYLERYDCISMLDRPISNAESAVDAIRQPVVKPDRDVRAFQDVLIDLGTRLKLPGLINDKGEPKYPGLFPDYMVNHERRPNIGMLGGWRGDNGGEEGVGPVNPRQLERYIENQCFWQMDIPHEAHFYKPWNRTYLDWAASMGFIRKADPIFIQLYSETIQKFRLVARGHGNVPIPDQHRERVATYFDPLPIWYMPFEEANAGGDFDFHAVTQRPMAMYHSWGSQNAWLRQIHGENMLHIHRETAAQFGIVDGDWVKLTSPHSSITVRAKLMDGVNKNTVWTWNAIGKRSGAWNLAPDANESKRGFLLNHLIRDLLPAREGGYRYSNSDPVTGQAAWYDLRVRIEKAAGKHEHSEPHFPTIKTPQLPERPDILRYGQKFRPEVKQ